MRLISIKTLGLAWVGIAGSAALGAGLLQASYVPPPAPLPEAVAPAPAPQPMPAALPQETAQIPFENHSLLAVLPPPGVEPLRVHPVAPHLAPPHALQAALPVPPIPPAPPREPKHEERRYASIPRARVATAQPYEVMDPWGGERLRYAPRYAAPRPYVYGPPGGYYGWQPYW